MEGVSAMFTTALAGVQPELLTVAGSAVGIGLVILVAKRGYGLIKSFTK